MGALVGEGGGELSGVVEKAFVGSQMLVEEPYVLPREVRGVGQRRKREWRRRSFAFMSLHS